jgi:hypothetical protein
MKQPCEVTNCCEALCCVEQAGCLRCCVRDFEAPGRSEADP